MCILVVSKTKFGATFLFSESFNRMVARFFEGKQQIISKKGGDRKNMREGTIEVQMSPCICRKNMGQYYI